MKKNNFNAEVLIGILHPDRLKINNTNILSFVLSLLKASTMNLPLFFLCCFALVWTYYYKKFSSNVVRSVGIFMKTQANFSSLETAKLALLLIFDCLSKSVLYWVIPIYNALLLVASESKLYNNCIMLSYEQFNFLGPSVHTNKLYRNATAIKDGCSLLVFDIIATAVELYVSINVLSNVIERNYFLYFILSILLVSIGHFFLISKLKKLKRESQDNQDQTFRVLTELFENFILTKTTGVDEKPRLSKFFESTATLKFSSCLSLAANQCKICIFISSITLLMASELAKENITVFLYHVGVITRCFHSFVTKAFDLESRRIEVLDMVQEPQTEQIEDMQQNSFNEAISAVESTGEHNSESMCTIQNNNFESQENIAREDNQNNSESMCTIQNNNFESQENIAREDNQNNSESMCTFQNNNFESQENIAREDNQNNNSYISNIINAPIPTPKINFVLENTKLSFIDLKIFINKHPILSNVSLDINYGDKIALIGSNGSGKTTFLRFLLGFIRYNGKVSKSYKNLSKRDFSYISQSKYLFKTVYEELMTFSDSEESMLKSCKKFGFDKIFTNLFNTDVSLLNESYCQMIAVIQAYQKKAHILLADEPLSFLDKAHEETVLNNLLDSPNQNIKIISHHNTSFLHKFNRVFQFDNNTIVEIDNKQSKQSMY